MSDLLTINRSCEFRGQPTVSDKTREVCTIDLEVLTLDLMIMK